MILITGATGNIGRHVVAELVARGLDVRALTRDPGRAALPAGAEVVAGDLARPETLPAALDGADSVFLFAVPGSGPAFVRAASAAGVRRVVLLSSAAVDDEIIGPDNPIAEYHAEIEDALRTSGLEWTFLRPGGFATNTLMWAAQTRHGDVVRGAYAQAKSAPIHEADIADVAVKALTTDGHASAVYRLTGPEPLTQGDQARILGEVLGRPIRFEEVPADGVRQAMSAHTPAPILAAIFSVWESSIGRPALVTQVVEEVTGKPARTFAQWATDHAAEF
jgi:uncharacterized protein YbjT (DUF2867 family)